MEQQYKYYYTYKVTCTEGKFKDKVYYGQHKTNNLNDGYKGSGKKLQNYYKKYPASYTMEIIQFYSSLDELNNAEYELIEQHLNKDYCLNLRDGGMQGTMSYESRQKISEGRKGKAPWIKGKHHTEESKQKMSKSSCCEKNGMYGKHHTEDTRNLISKTRKSKGVAKGKNNPNYGNVGELCPVYGKKWMNNGISNKYVNKEEINYYISIGYKPGMVKKK